MNTSLSAERTSGAWQWFTHEGLLLLTVIFIVALAVMIVRRAGWLRRSPASVSTVALTKEQQLVRQISILRLPPRPANVTPVQHLANHMLPDTDAAIEAIKEEIRDECGALRLVGAAESGFMQSTVHNGWFYFRHARQAIALWLAEEGRNITRLRMQKATLEDEIALLKDTNNILQARCDALQTQYDRIADHKVETVADTVLKHLDVLDKTSGFTASKATAIKIAKAEAKAEGIAEGVQSEAARTDKVISLATAALAAGNRNQNNKPKQQGGGGNNRNRDDDAPDAATGT